MKHKKTSYIVLASTLTAVSVFGTVLVHAFWYDGEAEAKVFAIPNNKLQASAVVVPEVSPFGNPLRLVIPTLDIDAKIQNVGINKKGNMTVPNNYTDVGWYKYGAAPGMMGSAVMAGHVSNGAALPGVFKHLEDLSEGDDIYVEMENGEKVRYVVSGFETYGFDEKPESVFAENDARYLKLITCTGKWMPSHKTHDKRLVVTAVQI